MHAKPTATASRGLSSLSYRGSTTATGTGITTLSLPTPAGTAAGDVLLVQLINRDNVSAVATVPAGWTLLRSEQSASAIKAWLFLKVAGASEPTSHAFSIDLASYMAGSMVAISGADPTNPIDVHVGQKNGNSASLALPPVSTSVGGGMAVWFGAQVWTGATCPAVLEPPTGFTERVETCLVSSSRGLLFNAATLELGAAGPQSAFTGSSPFPNTNVTHAVALRPAPVAAEITYVGSSHSSGKTLTSLAIPTPTGVGSGDVLLARLINRNHVEAQASAPAGWTFVRSDQSSWGIKAWVYVRVATSAEPTSHTFGLDVASYFAGSIVAYSGADPVNPIDAHSGQKNGDSTSFATPLLVTSTPGGTAVWFGSQVWTGAACPSPSIEPPAGFTESFDTCLLSSSSGLLFNAAYKPLTVPGLQPAFNGSSPFPNTNTAQVVALRAANAPTCTVGDTYSGSYTLQGTVSAPGIVEPSGLGASRLVDHALYVHNEDTTALVAINTLDASTLGTFQVTNVTPADWEDLATGPCPAGSCIFIGDIGRFSANFPTPPSSFAVYRVPEPDLANGQTTGGLVADAFPFVYPDTARDAESLMVHPVTGDIYVITKSGTGASKVYKFPQPLPAPGVQSTLIHVADLQLPTTEDPNFAYATAAAIHPCADRFLLRTYRMVYEFRAAPGQGFESAFAATPIPLTDTAEGQGEAIEYEANGASYFTMSESSAPFRLKRVSRQ